MFKCCDCERTFEEPKIVGELRPYGERWVTENFAACPYCGGSFENAYICKNCEEYFFENELTDHCCETCFEELYDKPDKELENEKP